MSVVEGTGAPLVSVVPEELATAAAAAAAAAGALESLGDLAEADAAVLGHAEVAVAVAALADDWRLRRQQLLTEVALLGAMLRAAAEAFAGADGTITVDVRP